MSNVTCPNCLGKGMFVYNEHIEPPPLRLVQIDDPIVPVSISLKTVRCGTCLGTGTVTFSAREYFLGCNSINITP